jgi:hypothetical protein
VALQRGFTIFYVIHLTLIDFQQGKQINLFTRASSQALGSNQPLIQRIKKDFSPSGWRREADHSPLSSAVVKNPRTLTATPHALTICTETLPWPYTLHWRVSSSCNEQFLEQPLRPRCDYTDITHDAEQMSIILSTLVLTYIAEHRDRLKCQLQIIPGEVTSCVPSGYGLLIKLRGLT